MGTARLAEFAAQLRFAAHPAAGAAQAPKTCWSTGSAPRWPARARGRSRRSPRFAETMGPADGPSEVLIDRSTNSPYLAAMVNAAASHCRRAGRRAQRLGVPSGDGGVPGRAGRGTGDSARAARSLLTAAVAGYEVGIRVGEFLGRSHYKVFHTTGTAGTLAAAAAAGQLLGLTPAQMLHAFGSAGTQSAGALGVPARRRPIRSSCTTAHAAGSRADGGLPRQGRLHRRARRSSKAPQGLAAGMSSDADPARLGRRLGSAGRLAETSFKYHASCRHTHPAADALLQVMREHDLAADDIARVVAHVHQGAIDVLGAGASCRPPCTRASSRWARCWRWSRCTAMPG